MGPTADIDAIHRLIGAQMTSGGNAVVDCATLSQLPELVFSIGGSQLALSGQDYVLEVRPMLRLRRRRLRKAHTA